MKALAAVRSVRSGIDTLAAALDQLGRTLLDATCGLTGGRRAEGCRPVARGRTSATVAGGGQVVEAALNRGAMREARQTSVDAVAALAVDAANALGIDERQRGAVVAAAPAVARIGRRAAVLITTRITRAAQSTATAVALVGRAADDRHARSGHACRSATSGWSTAHARSASIRWRRHLFVRTSATPRKDGRNEQDAAPEAHGRASPPTLGSLRHKPK